MKSTIFILTGVILILAINLNAQLTINSTGRVEINSGYGGFSSAAARINISSGSTILEEQTMLLIFLIQI